MLVFFVEAGNEGVCISIPCGVTCTYLLKVSACVRLGHIMRGWAEHMREAGESETKPVIDEAYFDPCENKKNPGKTA